MESSTWEQRIARGNECESIFAKELLLHGLTPIKEEPLDRTKKLVRHNPDIRCYEVPNVLFQVADGRRSAEHAHVIKQKDSIIGARSAASKGQTVFVCWLMPDGSWRGANINNLQEDGQIRRESRMNGSGTPAYKFKKTALQNLSILLREVKQPSLL